MKDVIKGCYLHYCDIENPDVSLTGIDKKVGMQVKAINDAGIDCSFAYVSRPSSFFRKAISCVPFISDGLGWPDPKVMGPLDFIYIRRPVYASSDFLRFLRRFREENPNAKVLYEIPTYPYDPEMTGVNFPALVKDRHHRRNMRGLVDYIVDLSGQSEIFGIPTIQITNGIDFDEFPIRAPAAQADTLNVLAVASFMPWHGIDRFIKGMADFYAAGGTKNIVLHLAGNGAHLPNLKKLVQSTGLDDRVVFHGFLSPEEIAPLYDRCDVAIECMGIHRRDSSLRSSSIKSREYLAKGIPFITSSRIDFIEGKEFDYCLSVPPNESPISMETVIGFVDGLYEREEPLVVATHMREFGIENVEMSKAMGNVIAALEDKAPR